MSQPIKSKYTLVIDILFLLLIGGLGYVVGTTTYDISSSGKIHKAEKMLKEVDTLKQVYENKIADKTISYKEIALQKEKINQLISELEDSKYKESTLLKYKNEYNELETKMQNLLTEIENLKAQKTSLPSQKSKVIATEIKKTKPIVVKNETIAKNNNPIAIPVEVKKTVAIPAKIKYSKIKISNVNSVTLNSLEVKNQVATDLYKKAKLIRISFTLDANPTAKAEDKTYYIQIINSKNNVIGKRITEYFDGELLTYSFTKTVNYQNNTVQIEEDLPYSNFEKGNYYVFIYDRNEMVGSSSFVMK